MHLAVKVERREVGAYSTRTWVGSHITPLRTSASRVIWLSAAASSAAPRRDGHDGVATASDDQADCHPMNSTPLSPPPATFAVTRGAAHRLAVYVISPARRRATGRIGLRAHPGGFATPPFG